MKSPLTFVLQKENTKAEKQGFKNAYASVSIPLQILKRPTRNEEEVGKEFGVTLVDIILHIEH